MTIELKRGLKELQQMFNIHCVYYMFFFLLNDNAV